MRIEELAKISKVAHLLLILLVEGIADDVI